MKMIRSKILFICFLALAPKAFAEKSCHSLFEITRLSENQVRQAVLELKDIGAKKYSSNPAESFFANQLFKEKIKELEQQFSKEEIRQLFLKYEIATVKKSKKAITHNKHIDQIVKTDDRVSAFLTKNGFNSINGTILMKNKMVTPLVAALKLNQFNLLEPLIERGADMYSGGTESPFDYAAGAIGKNEAVDVFLKYNVDVNFQRKNDRSTALMSAAFFGRENIVKLLLEKKANAQLSDIFDETPLHTAAKKGFTEIIELLIPHSNINAQTSNGNTALSLAVENKHIEAVKVLLSNKADPNIIVQIDDTALTMAINNKSLDIVKLLIQHGADVTHADVIGNGILTIFKDNFPKNRAMIKTLKDLGAKE